MNLSELLLRLRRRLDDTLQPYLWSDDTLTEYLNDAEREAAYRAQLVRQNDAPIPIRADTAKYELPWETLFVTSVRLASMPEYPLSRTSIRHQERFFGSRDQGHGTPILFALDQVSDIFRAITLLPVPAATDTLLLDIVRMPYGMSNDSDEPEIDSIYHADLLDWAGALAYYEQDSDAKSMEKAQFWEARFEVRFGPRLNANVMRERQTDVPLMVVPE